jgi:hypothetical protein
MLSGVFVFVRRSIVVFVVVFVVVVFVVVFFNPNSNRLDQK